jgi:uncharacterized membrane protein
MKSAHLIGVIFLLGNVSVTFMWKLFADDTEQPVVIAFSQRMVLWNDWAFTVIGVVLIIVSGYGMAWSAGLDLVSQGWLFWSQVWFYGAGLIWLFVLVPIQVVQARQARRFSAHGVIPESYRRLSWHWNVWGVLATVLLLVPLYLMIAKTA